MDEETDTLYLRLDESAIVESEEVQPGVVLDFNAENRVVGVEMLNISKRVERTHGWLDNWRRLVVRYDRHTDVYIAFLTSACFMTTLSKILG